MPDLRAALAERPVVLDGGLGTLLEARGNDLTSDLWSARLLRDHPDEVSAAHAEFVAAGADVLITSSYQLGFGAAVPDDDVEELIGRSVRVASAAGGRFVAASVGPYGAVRADGSEYTGDYGTSVAELRAWHRRRLHLLADAGADALAIETIPALAEVEALCAELADLGVPAWISLSASSTGWRGDDLAEAFALAAATPGVFATGVNCCAPETVLSTLAHVPSGVAGIAYPNSGERWDAVTRSWAGDAGIPTDAAQSWVEAGARLVGGCCRTTPADIAVLASAIRGD
ncbi:homocysteine S-methyltransferase [Microbacterium sp. RU33B]|uniref:homocysteine S-methyltransferase n=1 Tax=Microbacterium sp. RU33B TaxID=1907390 RepID=UPI0009603B40|nr:homocysteine S-methyltransferase [Microbacterium sp. RU33B]SIT67522.1 homocysteine S-methyltransferase [Microbacterium sp. RU33B]